MWYMRPKPKWYHNAFGVEEKNAKRMMNPEGVMVYKRMNAPELQDEKADDKLPRCQRCGNEREG
jgi:hypothetical protein